jgi:hypothetical protein
VRELTRLILGILLVALLAACGADDPSPSKESTMSKSVSMESAIADAEQMRQEMFRSLAAELGERRWAVTPNDDGPIRAGCDGDDGAETVSLRSYGFIGAYPPADWKKAADIVEKVGRAHGFDVVKVVVDRPGDFSMTGLSKSGGSYSFGMGKNAVLGINTGCHVWDDKPTPGG